MCVLLPLFTCVLFGVDFFFGNPTKGVGTQLRTRTHTERQPIQVEKEPHIWEESPHTRGEVVYQGFEPGTTR